MPSYDPSSTCQLEWRPSALAAIALTLLAALALVAILASALPRWAAVAASIVALAWGGAAACRDWRREACEISWRATGQKVRVEYAQRVEDWTQARWRLRGPLAVLTARDAEGRRRQLFWWPDTLPPSARRRLRIALSRPRSAAMRAASHLAI